MKKVFLILTVAIAVGLVSCKSEHSRECRKQDTTKVEKSRSQFS